VLHNRRFRIRFKLIKARLLLRTDLFLDSVDSVTFTVLTSCLFNLCLLIFTDGGIFLIGESLSIGCGVLRAIDRLRKQRPIRILLLLLAHRRCLDMGRGVSVVILKRDFFSGSSLPLVEKCVILPIRVNDAFAVHDHFSFRGRVCLL